MEKIYPAVDVVLEEMQKDLPPYWRVSYEYPNTIGVWHGSFVSDDQFINFGDVNGFFGFNDTIGNVCGYMENLTDPAEIVASFWDQVAKFYPDLFKGAN